MIDRAWLLKLAIDSGANADMAVSRAREFERYVVEPKSASPFVSASFCASVKTERPETEKQV
jgi:hypothetical protein